MKRLSVSEYYSLGSAIGQTIGLLKQSQVSRGALFFQLIDLQASLKAVIEDEDTFRLAGEEARQLSGAIDSVIGSHIIESDGNSPSGTRFKDLNEELHSWVWSTVSSNIDHFVHVFNAACRDAETYVIERKLIYDTSALLHRASEKIHKSIRDLVAKEALEEIDQAGRCFALEAFTASGFHALRGLELVMASYYQTINGSAGDFKSWSDYNKAFIDLEKSKEERGSKYPSAKVVTMLDRIRQLDRNPLMHPQDTLDEMSADTLFTVSVAAITEMAKDMRDMRDNPEQKQLTLIAGDAEPKKERKQKALPAA